MSKQTCIWTTCIISFCLLWPMPLSSARMYSHKTKKRSPSVQLIDAIANQKSLVKIRKLIDKGANVNAYSKKKNMFPILYATLRHHIPLVQLLLDNGATPNPTHHKGFTSLHCATQTNDFKMVTLLLQHGANPNALTRKGKTPLHYSVENRNSTITQLLLLHGADPRIVNCNDESPLDIAHDMGDFTNYNLLLLTKQFLTSNNDEKLKIISDTTIPEHERAWYFNMLIYGECIYLLKKAYNNLLIGISAHQYRLIGQSCLSDISLPAIIESPHLLRTYIEYGLIDPHAVKNYYFHSEYNKKTMPCTCIKQLQTLAAYTMHQRMLNDKVYTDLVIL